VATVGSLQEVKQAETADLAAVNQRVELIEAQFQQLVAGQAQTKQTVAQRAASHPAQKATRQRSRE
jgi:hypothetical protein